MASFQLNFAATTIDLLTFRLGTLTNAGIAGISASSEALTVAKRRLRIAAKVGAHAAVVATLTQDDVITVDAAFASGATLVPPEGGGFTFTDCLQL